MFESVFACESVNQTLPSVSSAVIIERRGETVFREEFPWPCLYAQALRMKLVSFSQVSSIFITLLFSERSLSNTRPYYYLRTRFLAEFAEGCNFFALTKLNLYFFFKASRTCFTLTFNCSLSLIISLTFIALSMTRPSLSMRLIAVAMAFLFHSASFYFSFVFRNFSG